MFGWLSGIGAKDYINYYDQIVWIIRKMTGADKKREEAAKVAERPSAEVAD